MATILDTLVAETRRRVAAARRARPVRALESEPRYGLERRAFAAALRTGTLAIIAESKKASPSQGIIRPDYDPAAIAEAYSRGGADAVSVLTEPAHFLGDPSHLSLVRDHIAAPVLRKDFIVDEYQIVEARAYGADAVLLIATVLERGHLTDLLQAARGLGLGVLVEFHAARELDRADFDLVEVAGVNNRDLHTFTVDRDHAVRVLASVPVGIVRVAESGLRTAEDLAHVRRAGIDAVLIGEAFMRADDPGEALATLRAETERLLES